MAQQSNSLMEKVMAMNEVVKDPERQVGNLNSDSLPSLPVGLVKKVGQTDIIIAIDSAYFLPDGAYFSAYLALDFPGAEQPLAFAAKDIKFNPKGIIGGEQSKLVLVSQHLIETGPNTKLLLENDGQNFVSWSCNGFESVSLHGKFLLSGNIVSPPENSADTCVTAEFSVVCTDLNNMLAMVDFSPFVVKGMEDFSFTVSEAYVDMSDYNNPPVTSFPACYNETYAGNLNLWRGFYLKQFSVELPEELNKNENPITLFASNMFVDDAGITGDFGGTNLFSTYENAMNDEWGFSADSLMIGLTLNKITKGKLTGDLIVPPLNNNTLEYRALIVQNDNTRMVDYSFSMSPSENLEMPAFNSTLVVYENSLLSVSRVNRKFRPQLKLNGQWTLDNSSWKFQGIGFENFTLTTVAPYVTNGYFSLISQTGESQGEAGNFPVSLSDIGFGIINQQPVLGATISLNLGGDTLDQSTGFSASTAVKVFAEITENSSGKHSLAYDHFSLSSISLSVNTTAVNLTGIINYHQNDPVYGKGFYGGLLLKINNVMDAPMSMACAFGRVNGYRYWMVDATLPTDIPLGPTIKISSITGGVSYHMINQRSKNQMIGSVSPTASSGSALSPDYVPDQNTGLIFKAGAGFCNRIKEDALNGDALLVVAFNSNGGLQYINLSGNAYLMCKPSERFSSTNYVNGAVNVNYDNQEKIFNAQLNMNANFSNAVTATIWSQIYISPNLWYVHLGKPSNPCSANILNLATAQAYFMFGQSLEPMPNPPPQVASVFNTMSDQRNETSIASGSGIACGMNFNASFDKSFDVTENISVYAAGWAGAGFDMTLYKYASTSHCEGSAEPFGMNYWFLQGQLYAYMGLDIGAAWKDHSMTVLQGSVAALLQGKMPKPSYVYGGLNVQANLFDLFDLNMTVDFDFGTNCVIVNG
ncbi:MAG: hypothetical protein IPM77_03570 [Crocinitomicaceae bacterium]|nr:hypothetical protein [Crocinitomicaceae bacterium]